MIIGMIFSSISVNINESKLMTKGITVSSAPTIKGVEKAEVLDMKDVVKIKFDFTTKYEPDVGTISFEGAILWRGKDSKKMLKLWEEEKKLESNDGVEILNVLFRKCLAKSIVLAEEVHLPPPMQFPVVQVQNTEEKKD